MIDEEYKERLFKSSLSFFYEKNSENTEKYIKIPIKC